MAAGMTYRFFPNLSRNLSNMVDSPPLNQHYYTNQEAIGFFLPDSRFFFIVDFLSKTPSTKIKSFVNKHKYPVLFRA